MNNKPPEFSKHHGQLKTYTNAEGVTVSYEYNANQQLTKLTIPTVGDITQSDFNWLAPQKVTTDIMNYGYMYDKVGNIMQKTTEHGNYQYAYDKAYRLKSAINPTLDNESYTYDKVGNRLTSASTAGNWTYDNSDQLLSTPTDTYEYTQNGNTKKITPADTTQKPSEYFYNARDRLAEVKKDNATIQSNRYDFAQRRIAKITTNGETYFLYGQTGLLAEYQSNGDFIQGYGYYPNASYTTNPVYTLKQSGGNYQADFYHNDHLATPQKLTNSTGAVSWAMESNAFGETTLKTQTTTNNLRFPGQYADSDIGLNQNYFRDYAPHLGRYVETDPIGFDGGINVFNYVNQNAISYFDVMGLAKWKGTYTEFSLGHIYAGKRMLFELESECIDNIKYKIKVEAIGAGIILDVGVLGPVSLGSGSAKFNDRSSKPNPEAFNGLFSYLGINSFFGGIGTAILGSAVGDLSGFGFSSDLLSADAVVGSAEVTNKEKIKCCNE